MSTVFPAILGGFWIWGKLETLYLSMYQYEPVPIPSNPQYRTKDVSIVVCSIGPSENFTECLSSWLLNDPLEVIIVTTDQYRDIVETILQRAQISLGPRFPNINTIKLKVLGPESLGKRRQSVWGFAAAQGSIIASVDDHILWPEQNFLPHMLACFEDPEVGGVAPTCGLYMPDERRDENVITPWEVAAARSLWKGKARYLAVYAACGWSWVLPGMTCLYRASILKDTAFQEKFLREYWRGKGPLDVHDDGFITRWAHQKNWKLCVQDAGPETETRRTVKQDKSFLPQFFRWERGSIQSHIIYFRSVPQIWGHPYVAFKTVERIFRPLITFIHIWAWMCSLHYYPRATALFFFFYIITSASSYAAFIAEHPYMWRQWWAAVLFDYFYVIQDYYCWWTIKDTRWGGRHIVGQQ